MANLANCPGVILTQVGYMQIKPVVDSYIAYLQNQAGNNVFAFDDNFINRIQRFYPFDLHSIRYATGINTVHGQNITIWHTIHFTGSPDLTNPFDAALAYHELEHVAQYNAKGSVDAFMAQYILQSSGSILHGGNSVDIHNNIGLEQDAINKASQVSNALAQGNGGGPFGNVQPIMPMQPQMGRVCHTPFGACLLPVFGQVGVSCYCGTPRGPINGQVGIN